MGSGCIVVRMGHGCTRRWSLRADGARNVTCVTEGADAVAVSDNGSVRDLPIGIFDSGVGGLTVARAVLDQLPTEPIVYVGDTARGPYGPLPLSEVHTYAVDVMDHLVQVGVKLLVIACNSASAACLHDARERYDVPVVEVIHPAVRRAVAATRNGKVGVIGTTATVSSGAYDEAFAETDSDVVVSSVACPSFVEHVERGDTFSPTLLRLAEDYLAPLVDAGVDTLVLGCTHYPLLTGALAWVMGDGVTLVSSAEETAKDVYRALAATGQFRSHGTSPPEHRFLATGDPVPFQLLAHRFLGPEIGTVESAAAVLAESAGVPAAGGEA